MKLKKCSELKTQLVLDLLYEDQSEILDQTGEIPTLYVETVAEELAYRENKTYDDRYVVLIEKALDELQDLGIVEVKENNEIIVL